MKSSKKIDSFYQRNLRDAEVTPPEDVWENIASRLPKREPQKKGIPWHKIAGAAAVLVLLFSLPKVIELTPSSTESAVSMPFHRQQELMPIYSIHEQIRTEMELVSSSFNEHMAEPNNLLRSLMDQSHRMKLKEARAGKAAFSESLSAEKNIQQDPDPAFVPGIHFSGKDWQKSLGIETEISGGDFLQLGLSSSLLIGKGIIGPGTTIADAGDLSHPAAEISEAGAKEDFSVPGLAANHYSPGQETGISTATAGRNGFENQRADKLNDRTYKKENILDVGPSEEPQVLAYEEEKLATEKKDKSNFSRLSISTKVAPVYFSTGKGNAFDPQFSGNKSTGEVSLSYGVSFAYRISPKLKLRSGLNKLSLGYNTRGVDFHSAVSSAALDQERAAVSVLTSPVRGNLHQEMGFTEVPVEVEYLLLDSRIGVSLVLGASSLFLDKNNTFLESSVYSTDLGEAQNLNKLSFSTNIGLGLSYKISPRFRVNMEPMLKYQLDTFRASGLNPYYFGLYSGFSFGF